MFQPRTHHSCIYPSVRSPPSLHSYLLHTPCPTVLCTSDRPSLLSGSAAGHHPVPGRHGGRGINKSCSTRHISRCTGKRRDISRDKGVWQGDGDKKGEREATFKSVGQVGWLGGGEASAGVKTRADLTFLLPGSMPLGILQRRLAPARTQLGPVDVHDDAPRPPRST